jgi:hypothetical protein
MRRPHFTRLQFKPRGENIVKSAGEPHVIVRGRWVLQDKFKRSLGIKPGETPRK